MSVEAIIKTTKIKSKQYFNLIQEDWLSGICKKVLKSAPGRLTVY